ncbi:MAG TPA: tRNA pseudouridine(13) synthase TruD [Steroidobacteraceae bacterium]|nr:tRNA pseudouridine(13) synthase TruD [Steroidobacteraceae bacterium]
MNVHGRHADAWNRAAFEPPRAHGPPLSPAEFKAIPDDFRVEEQLSFTPSGSGPHWLIRVEKRGANTRWVAAELARLAQVPTGDVGFAGLKDRHAVTVQWFSVPVRSTTADYWSAVHSAEFRVLEVLANSRKLKRGALTGNRFRIRLRRPSWSREQLELKLAAVRMHGVPNYFGPQRFGREGYNLDRVQAWLRSGHAPPGRTERGFALSAARSLLFNAVLARRVEAGDWSQLSPGDLASLDGSGSHFKVDAVNDEMRRRVAALDIHPSGPLWGRGELPTEGQARGHEMQAAEAFKDVAGLLAAENLAQERRSLRCAVRELVVESEPGATTLGFTLGRGQFATSVLREICEFGPGLVLESDEDAEPA